MERFFFSILTKRFTRDFEGFFKKQVRVNRSQIPSCPLTAKMLMLLVYKNIKNFLIVPHIRQRLYIYCYRIISYRALQYFRAKAHEIFSSHSLEGNFKVTRTVLYTNKNMLIIRTDFLYDHFAFVIHVSRLQKRYRYLKRHKIIIDVILILYYKETTYIILFRTKKPHYCLLKSLGSFGKLFTSK